MVEVFVPKYDELWSVGVVSWGSKKLDKLLKLIIEGSTIHGSFLHWNPSKNVHKFKLKTWISSRHTGLQASHHPKCWFLWRGGQVQDVLKKGWKTQEIKLLSGQETLMLHYFRCIRACLKDRGHTKTSNVVHSNLKHFPMWFVRWVNLQIAVAPPFAGLDDRGRSECVSRSHSSAKSYVKVGTQNMLRGHWFQRVLALFTCKNIEEDYNIFSNEWVVQPPV